MANNHWRIAFEGSYAGVKVVNGLHMAFSESDSPPVDPTDFTSLVGAWLAAHPTNYTLDVVRFQKIARREDLQPVAVLHPVGSAGTQASSGDALASVISQVATIYTPVASRKFRSSIHFVGGHTTDITGQDWDNSGGRIRPARETFLAAVLGSYDNADDPGQWECFSHKLWKTAAPGANLDDFGQPVTGYLLRAPVRSMRSRLT